MRRHKLYIKRGHLGIKGLKIMISNEIKALMSNKHIIYQSLLSPILYLLFFSIGIKSTFGDIVFSGIKVNFLAYSLVGIFTMSVFREMYHCVYRMITDKRWGLLSLKILNGINPPIYSRHIDISYNRSCYANNYSLFYRNAYRKNFSILQILYYIIGTCDFCFVLVIFVDLYFIIHKKL